MLKEAKFEELVGKIIENVSINTDHRDDGCLVSIKTIDFLNVRDKLGHRILNQYEHHVYKMIHNQNCCEDVYLDEFSLEELRNILHKKILSAEVVTNDKSNDNESILWTFYKLRAHDGTSATLRFIGESNGYYSVDVDFYEEVS